MSKKYKEIIDNIEKLTVKELADFVKELEDKFGPVTVAAGVALAAEEKKEEKSEYALELTSAGSSAISVIKIVKEVSGLGLMEAKKMVDSAPVVIKEKVKKEEGEEIKKKLEEAGAMVELK